MEGQEMPGIPGEAAEVERILKRCMDAPGYVLFVGIMRSENGNLFLDSEYRKFHVNLDDMALVLRFIGRTLRDEGLDPVAILNKPEGGPNG